MTDISTVAANARAERRSKYHEADVVVVGAGVFGCAIAYALGQQGRSVILLERWMKEPDRIVGELLQPGGIVALRQLGLADTLEGIDAMPCSGYKVSFHGEGVDIPYPSFDENGRMIHPSNSTESTSSSAKQKEGRCFHHGRFIMNLRRACQRQENITIFETEVTATVRGDDQNTVLGVRSKTTDPVTGDKKDDYFFGQLTIIADGYASKFRKECLPEVPTVKSKFYALELIDAPMPSPGYGHVVIGKAFPVLMYQIGTHETRALIDVPANIPEAAPAAGGVRGYIKNVVMPSLSPQMRPCFEAALADGKIPRSMPNSYLPPSRQTANGMLLLGDALNMRHPLTGGGMTVAFNDCVILSDLLHPSRVSDLADPVAIKNVMREFHWRRKSLTSIINVLAMALYALFAANDRQLRALQMGCFQYFHRGHAAEPMALMGGLMHQPSRLAYHFFSVAFLAIWLNALDVMSGSVFGFLKAPLALIDGILILWRASVVFLPVMWRELR
ncbi:Putative FAD dependent oxidoreductase, squalene epoxidase, FAD/NAD(P)-binding domain superfamily [Colletotrichum destructivum]|uniref:Squalene monooxygenase n=1 Tax=Colletotrichum destructivum TaxID=34406 RepID=A0AAX4IA37_9PEZI|nr:Putative FAD dependent oxidoreductase, squalene epoxidase, FAD/NAD(P)-binding domain superfamily [Colletotrichum destructivum]